MSTATADLVNGVVDVDVVMGEIEPLNREYQCE